MNPGLEVSPARIKGYLTKLKNRDMGKKASAMRMDIQSITSQYAGVVRTEEGLRKGLKELMGLKKEKVVPDEKGLVFALETENIRDVAEMVLRACLMRKESRGPHLFFGRFDDSGPLPIQDPKWRKYIVLQNRLGRMILKKQVPVKLEV